MNISRDTFATIATAVYLGWFCFTFDRTSTALFYMSLLLGQSELVQQILRYFVILDSKAADLAFLPMTEEIACPSAQAGLITELLRYASSCRYAAVSGMNIAFAPLSAKLVCWNNQITIENEVLNFFEMFELVTYESVNPVFSLTANPAKISGNLRFFCSSDVRNVFFRSWWLLAGMWQMAIFHQPSPSLGFQVITDQVWISIW